MKYLTSLMVCMILISVAQGQMVIKNSTNTEIVRITSSGNVGIGTTNPLEKLCVSGNVRVTDTGNLGVANLGGSGDVWIRADNTGVLYKSTLGPGPSVRMKAYNDTALLLPAGTWDRVEWNRELYDSHDAFANNEFTAPITGWYHIRIRLSVSRSAVTVYVTKNGYNYAQIVIQCDFGNISAAFAEDVLELQQNDVLRVYTLVAAGEDAYLEGPGDDPTFKAPNWYAYNYFSVMSMF